MKGPPAGSEALPASRIEFVPNVILSDEDISYSLCSFAWIMLDSGATPVCISEVTARTKPLVAQPQIRRCKMRPTSHTSPATDAAIPKPRA